MAEPKNWWAPVWRGLVCEVQAVHYRRMKTAVWLYLFLLMHADRRKGNLRRKISTICRDSGISRDAVVRWLGLLRHHGYIESRNTGRCLEIQITKWKPLPGAVDSPPQKSEQSNARSGKNPTAQTGLVSLKDVIQSHRRDDRPRRNKIP